MPKKTEYSVSKSWKRSPEVWAALFWWWVGTVVISVTIGIMIGEHLAGRQ